ncbi:hypothetical protein [Bartonella sp. CL29QHWL]|uniref:hypothetical protein n=1 Tax=Bartonella sp. CL29QHWL TaxID=3243522 RepID=UPI0035D0B838
MAGIGMLFGSAVINAVAFTGSGYLFKSLDKNGYEAEIKRHNRAQEELQKASTEWEEHRKSTIDFVNLELKRERDASIDFKNTDAALSLYNYLHPNKKIVLNKRPELSDYYQPSDEMKKYEYLWIILGMSSLGLIIYYFSK